MHCILMGWSLQGLKEFRKIIFSKLCYFEFSFFVHFWSGSLLSVWPSTIGDSFVHSLCDNYVFINHQLYRALWFVKEIAGEWGIRKGEHFAQLECAAPLHQLFLLQSPKALRPPRKLLKAVPNPRLDGRVAFPAPRIHFDDCNVVLPEGTSANI